MKISQLSGKKGYHIFSDFGNKVYEGNPYYRGTEVSIEKLILLGPTAFHKHARVKFFVVEDGNDIVARFALIHDQKLSDYIQVSFFEAHSGLNGIWKIIQQEILEHFSKVPKALVGLNGHLNYSAGFLMSHYDQPPVFGLPYSQPYYPDYFKGLHKKLMVSYRFTLAQYVEWLKNFRLDRHNKDVTLRVMDKSKIREEIKRYTILNNLAFQDHIYWADRDIEEDMELLYPFRLLLKNENLIFAEYKGEPIGFFLWYPDYNELVSGLVLYQNSGSPLLICGCCNMLCLISKPQA
jgi:hypothetical protein